MRLAVVALCALFGCAANDAATPTTTKSAVTEIGTLNNCVEAITEEGTAAANEAVTSGDPTAIERTIDACAPAALALDGELRDLVDQHQSAAAGFVATIADKTATAATASAFNAETLRWFERVEVAAQRTLGA